MMSNRKLLFVLYGGPGSGKSTQAQLLARIFVAPSLNMGGALRHLAQGKTALTQQVRKIITQGKLVPLAVTREIVESFCRQHQDAPLLVIDGYPRNLPQSRVALGLAKKYQRRIVFIFLDLPMRVAIDRLLQRARIEGRIDDQDPKILAERIRIFKREARLLLSFFKRLGLLVRVSGRGTEKEVLKRLVALVKKYQDGVH